MLQNGGHRENGEEEMGPVGSNDYEKSSRRSAGKEIPVNKRVGRRHEGAAWVAGGGEYCKTHVD